MRTLDDIREFFLSAKHWQIFALLVGTELAGFIGSIAIAVSISSQVGGIVGALSFFPSYLCLLAWWWSIGLLLHSQIRPQRELNLSLFRFAFLWLVLGPLTVSWIPQTSNPLLMGVGATAALSFAFFIFYILFFLSKSLTIRNKGRDVLGGGDVVFFFLFFLFFAGVWFIQPRINQLNAEQRNPV